MKGLWSRIRKAAFTDVRVLVRGLDYESLASVERVLIEADLGPAVFDLMELLEREVRAGRLRTEDQLREWLVAHLASLLPVPPTDLAMGDGNGPAVILFVGVNGVGKTTQVAKVAALLQARGHHPLLAAADTYRAGAVDQLRVWSERVGTEFVGASEGTDPAAVAFDAVRAAAARHCDVVLVDTAGRLHTKDDLMGELQKIHRVCGKVRPGAPHETILVLDGTVGQNAVLQGREFQKAVPLTGLLITKLDGTARGGAVVAVSRELGVPVRFLGTGENVGDLEPFTPRRFAERLLSD